MCKCTPEIKTPYCGKGDCVWPREEEIKYEVKAEKLPPDTVKMIMRGLDEEFEKKKQAFIAAKNAIKELCPHTEGTEAVMIGEICTICGKVLRRY